MRHCFDKRSNEAAFVVAMEKTMQKFTVLVSLPMGDSVNNPATFLAHVNATGPIHASELARAEAHEWLCDDESLDRARVPMNLFRVLFMCNGHVEDISFSEIGRAHV